MSLGLSSVCFRDFVDVSVRVHWLVFLGGLPCRIAWGWDLFLIAHVMLGLLWLLWVSEGRIWGPLGVFAFACLFSMDLRLSRPREAVLWCTSFLPATILIIDSA